jgi:hypothetical protein
VVDSDESDYDESCDDIDGVRVVERFGYLAEI